MECHIGEEDLQRLKDLFHIRLQTDPEYSPCEVFSKILVSVQRASEDGNNCFVGWTVDRILGMGAGGTVLGAHRHDGRRVAFKIVVEDAKSQRNSVNTPQQEIAIHGKFAALGLAPPPLCHEILRVSDVSRLHILAMDEIPQIGVSHLAAIDAVEMYMSALVKMRGYGLTHGDSHHDNLFASGRYGSPSIEFIDFGMATDQIYFPYLDVSQFLRGLRDVADPHTFKLTLQAMNEFLGENETFERAAPLGSELTLPITGDDSQWRLLAYQYSHLVNRVRGVSNNPIARMRESRVPSTPSPVLPASRGTPATAVAEYAQPDYASVRPVNLENLF